jgi:WG containing repeat
VPAQYRVLDGDFSNGWFVIAYNDYKKKLYYTATGSTIAVPDGMSLLSDAVDGKKFIAVKNGLYGITDKQFKELLPFEYSSIRASEGLLLATKNSLVGVLDAKLKWVVEPQYSSMGLFINGYAVFTNAQKKQGAINTKGKITTPPQFGNIYRIDKEPTTLAMFQPSNYDRSGIVNLATGAIIVPPDYYFTPYDYRNGYITFKRDNKRGIMDSTGKEVVYGVYDDFSPGFLNDMAWVSKEKKYGFINKTGQLVIPIQYESVGGFSEGLARVKLNGRWGFINSAGNTVIPFQFTETQNFESGSAWVRDEKGRTFYIDKTGKEIK